MKKVLVTGASGFLGGEVVNTLKQHPGFEVYTLGRCKSSTYCYNIGAPMPPFECSFDLVVHIAGKAHSIPRMKEEIEAFYNVNVEGTRNLLRSLTEKPPRSFVFISSVAVYGADNGENIDEQAHLKATDPYGNSKVLAEEAVLEWGKRYNVNVAVLRLPLIVGTNAPGNLGKMKQAILKGYYFSVGRAKARKSMVLANDVALIIPQAGEVGGIFNLTDGVHPTVKEVEYAIGENLGKKRIFRLPRIIALVLAKAGDVINTLKGGAFPFSSSSLKKLENTLTFSDKKAVRELNWNPQPVLQFLKQNTI